MKKIILAIILFILSSTSVYAEGYFPVPKWTPQEKDLGWSICKPNPNSCGSNTFGTQHRTLTCSLVSIWAENKKEANSQSDNCNPGKYIQGQYNAKKGIWVKGYWKILPDAKEQERQCNSYFKQPCPINGGWSEWSKCYPASYDITNKTFAGHQYRICNNPYPMFGGKECDESNERFQWQSCDYKQITYQ